MGSNLKLFVWEGVLRDYSSGVMFALATDVETARKLIIEKEGDLDSVIRDLQTEYEVYETECGFAVWGGG
jgi:hypothetical protein